LTAKKGFPYRSLVSLAILALLVLWAVTYLSDHFDEFKKALAWPLPCLVLASLLTVIRFGIVGQFTQIILRAFGLTLTFREWFGLPVITTLGNYVLPFRGGSGLRAAYLKKRHAFPLTDFLSTFVAIYLVVLIVNAAVGLTALALSPSWRGPGGTAVALFFGLVLAGSLGLVIFPLPKDGVQRLKIKTLIRLVEGWQKIKEHPQVTVRLFIMSLANTVTGMLVVYVGFLAMDVRVGLAGSALVVALQALTLFMAVTPGGLGIQDAVLVFTAQALGVSPTQGLALAVAVRALTLFWSLILGPVFSYLLLKKPVPVGLDEP